ncbi:hypothetical protein SCLARK_00464 [Spiroplasma clarkii]|nr:hypothetical protein SCLARK_00464 [Spiroplasma clarkii]
MWDFSNNQAQLTSQKMLNYKNLTSQFLNDFVNICDELLQTNVKIVREYNANYKLFEEVVFFQSLVTQYALKIKNNQKEIAEIKQFIPEIIAISEKFEKYTPEFLKSLRINREKYAQENTIFTKIKQDFFF